MKVHIQLFLVAIIATCQARLVRDNNLDPLNQNLENFNNQAVYLRQYPNAEQASHRFQLAKVERRSKLDEIDREALSRLSETDRNLLLSKLTKADREWLLTKLDEGKLHELFPTGENRFGDIPSTGLSGLAAQVGASAGGYIGGKLAGFLGTKLGAAAGAYIGAAAASRLEGTVRGRITNVVQNVGQPRVVKHGYGAVMVN